jgi:AcrR family transcriptional regulator
MEPQERIVGKAHELFMRYGIRSISMDEVANQLGMSKKTIYQFYTDKDALVEDVINIELGTNETECRKQKVQSENAVHEMFLALDMVMEVFTKMNPAVIFDLEKYHPKAFKKYSDYKNKFLYTVIKENLDNGIAEGLYREEVQTDIMTRFRLASIFLVLNPDLFPLSKHNLAEVITEITDNFLYGLVTPKGQKLVLKYKQQRQKNHKTYA